MVLVRWLGGLSLVGFLILGSLSLFIQWCGTSKGFHLPPKKCVHLPWFLMHLVSTLLTKNLL